MQIHAERRLGCQVSTAGINIADEAEVGFQICWQSGTSLGPATPGPGITNQGGFGSKPWRTNWR